MLLLSLLSPSMRVSEAILRQVAGYLHPVPHFDAAALVVFAGPEGLSTMCSATHGLRSRCFPIVQ